MSRWFQTGERILDSNMHLNCFYSVRTLFIHTKEVRIRYNAKCLFTTCMMRQEQLNSKSLYVGTENESIAWPFSFMVTLSLFQWGCTHCSCPSLSPSIFIFLEKIWRLKISTKMLNRFTELHVFIESTSHACKCQADTPKIKLVR
jgi:hypothetical protein